MERVKLSLLEWYRYGSLAMLMRFAATRFAMSAKFLPKMPKILQFLEVSAYEDRLVWNVYWKVSLGCQNKLSIWGTTSRSICATKASTSPLFLSTSCTKYPFSLKNSVMLSTPLSITFGSSATTTLMAGHRSQSCLVLRSKRQLARSRVTRSLILLKPNLLQLSMRQRYCDFQLSLRMQRVILTKLSQKLRMDCYAGRLSISFLNTSRRIFSRCARISYKLLSIPLTVLAIRYSLEKANFEAALNIIQSTPINMAYIFYFMQARRHTLLDTFFQYCGRTSQSATLSSCGDGRLRYQRSSFYRRNQRKGKQVPNSVGIEVALPQKKERSRKEKIFNTNQMLCISPAVVYSSYEGKHPYLKNQSSITVSRRYCRAKTEGGDTNRSISSSLSYYKPQKLGETHASETSPKTRAKQRPMTAVPNVPASPLSINRLRSIHVQLPQRKSPQMNDYTLNGWETMVD